MNRYLIRAFVAILTFCIGVAVGSLRPRSSPYCRDRVFSVQTVEREGCRKRARLMVTPYVSVDTTSTDPARLAYSSTTTKSGNNPFLQNVELLVDNASDREIRNVTVGFVATRSHGDYNAGYRTGWKLIGSEDKSGGALEHAPVAIECGLDEALIAWIATIEFEDGSRWVNPRHVE